MIRTLKERTGTGGSLIRLLSQAAAPAVFLSLVGCASTTHTAGPHTAELRGLFEDDQRVRMNGFQGITQEELALVLAEDSVRKARVMELLKQDALTRPEDCYRAAMILQHGNEPVDFLLSHTLATAAAQEGYEAARWLSAASLDRYLMSIDQPQMFRTQYNSLQGGAWTQDPTLDLLGDSLRANFGVPTLADSQRTLEDMNGD